MREVVASHGFPCWLTAARSRRLARAAPGVSAAPRVARMRRSMEGIADRLTSQSFLPEHTCAQRGHRGDLGAVLLRFRGSSLLALLVRVAPRPACQRHGDQRTPLCACKRARPMGCRNLRFHWHALADKAAWTRRRVTRGMHSAGGCWASGRRLPHARRPAPGEAAATASTPTTKDRHLFQREQARRRQDRPLGRHLSIE